MRCSQLGNVLFRTVEESCNLLVVVVVVVVIGIHTHEPVLIRNYSIGPNLPDVFGRVRFWDPLAVLSSGHVVEFYHVCEGFRWGYRH
jgi:hypothetical protein